MRMRPLGRTKRRRKHRKKTFEVRCVSCAHDQSFVALLRWMKEEEDNRNGVVLQNSRCLGLCDFHDTGRGMRALHDVKSGDRVVSLPLHLLITPDTVLSSPLGSTIQKWHQAFTPQTLLTLFLATERAKGRSSVWSPYINTLPEVYSIPVYFSPHEMGLLTPGAKILASKATERFLSAKQNIMSFYSRSGLSSHMAVPVDGESLKWAWAVVETRSVYLETKPHPLLTLKPDESHVALAPFLDMLNHSDTAEVKAGLNADTNCYEIICVSPYPKHSQVFISYGAHDNMRLLVNYGFTLPNNVNNCFLFSVADLRNCFSSLPHWNEKEEKLEECQLHKHLWKRVILGDDLSQENSQSALEMAYRLVMSSLTEAQKHLQHADSQPQSMHKDLIMALAFDDVNILEKSLQLLQVEVKGI